MSPRGDGGGGREAHGGSCWLFPVGGTHGAREPASSAQQGARSLEELPVSQAFLLSFLLPVVAEAAESRGPCGPNPGGLGVCVGRHLPSESPEGGLAGSPPRPGASLLGRLPLRFL